MNRKTMAAKTKHKSAAAIVEVPLEQSGKQPGEFRFGLDAPAIVRGAAVEPIVDRLMLRGWLLSRSGIAEIGVLLDDQPLGDAHYGLARSDVGAAFPKWPNSMRSGYAFYCSLSDRPQGSHTVRLSIRAKNGKKLVRTFLITLKTTDNRHDRAEMERQVPRSEVDLMIDLLADLDFHPAYRFILRQGSAINIDRLSATLQALHLQVYSDWDMLLLAESDDVVTALQVIIEAIVPNLQERFTIIRQASTEIWTAPLVAADAQCDNLFYAFLAAGDELNANGLLELAAAGAMHREADFIHSEKVRRNPAAREPEPQFKSGLLPDLPLEIDDPGQLWIVSSKLLAKAGISPASLLHNGETHLAARCAALATCVYHGPCVLSHRPAIELSSPPPTEFCFELESPIIANGTVVESVATRMTISGWLLSRSGIANFVVFLDDLCLGEVLYGLARNDVGVAFPDWPGSLRSGYAFHCSLRSLHYGTHTVRLAIRANSGQEMERKFQITVEKSDDQRDEAEIRRRLQRPEIDLMAGLLTDLDYHPAYRFILRHGPRIDINQLTTTVRALGLQAYTNWSVLVLAETKNAATRIRATIRTTLPHLLDRFDFVVKSDHSAWIAPLTPADGRDQCLLYALLTVGDEIATDALLQLAVAGAMNRDADLIYSDEIRPNPVTRGREPFFKPDFSPDLLLATNYFGRLWVVSAELLTKIDFSPAGLLADGEYDTVLRCVEVATRIHHIPKLLCQRAAIELDDVDRERAALNRTLIRRGIAGEVLRSSVFGTWRLKRRVVSKDKVSIIIPTCAAHSYVEICIKTLRARTSYTDYEIIVAENVPDKQIARKTWVLQNADKVVKFSDEFNWSIFNNRAVDVADGNYLLFLNDDVEVIQDDWLDVMMENAQRPEVGVTGGRLLYPDGKVQHAGMFLAEKGLGRHAFRFIPSDDPGYFGLAQTQRNVIAVTGACMLVRRDTFERLGRFEEGHQIVNGDLDFCLRAHRAGLLTVFTPYATLIHHEQGSRARLGDIFDSPQFDAVWKPLFAAGDPYFNPNLVRHAEDYRPDDERVEWVTAGTPVFHVREIERILVVKLDHVGDFVTALPAIRRLKEIFSYASITVLAAPISRELSSLEPCIDEFLSFAFFHARSQFGELQLQKEDFIGLNDRLRPYRFDLAIDLRKHTATREVLKCTGARFLAGFDYLGQFPFLDVALDWNGDNVLRRKRSHVSDDLIVLVNAIGQATKADRLLVQPTPALFPLETLPSNVQALFAKNVIAIHPGAGNTTKQWPAEHFSALIELLIARHDVNVLLVGGPDEVSVANTLLEKIPHSQSIASMAGKASLTDLPGLLLRCALFIGNDSGPKHIAAAVGIPTIGVHSGVVDPVEWGPLGPRAVALRRNMTCSPCYLADAKECPRSLACLRLLEPNVVYEAANMLLGSVAPVIRVTDSARIKVPAKPV